MVRRQRIIGWILAGCLLLLGVTGVALRFHFRPRTIQPVPMSAPDVPNVKDAGEFLQGRGETLLKRRYALSLVPVYEKMLSENPESLDLKKKLADLYEEAGEHEKARSLFSR